MASHYPYDRSYVRRHVRRDEQAEADQAREHGFITYKEFGLVPLREIKPERVWKEVKLERVLEDIERGKDLNPIHLTPVRGKLEITDGIHRYNASKIKGYTHIPAIITRHEDRPDLLETRESTYSEGDFVEFVKPIDGFRYGYLAEKLGGLPGMELFVVIAGDAQESKWVGDISASEFKKAIRPDRKLKDTLLSNWYLAQKVSSRYLK